MATSDERLVTISKALSDKIRLKILTEIMKRKSITCNEVTKIAGLSQPAVSHHLKILHNSGLLNAIKEGRYSNLSINRKTFNEFQMMIKDFT